MHIDDCFGWNTDIPPVFSHTSLKFLTACPGFNDAKHGDLRAAIKIVENCAKYKNISEIRRNFPNAIMLPIMSRNKLPQALASIHELKVCREVEMIKTVLPRKHMSALERLLATPFFEGKIKRDGEYILVDDIITQGGTMSSLKNYVMSRGGRVVAVTSLACSASCKNLVPKKENINKLNALVDVEILKKVLKIKHLNQLTDAQIKYILKFKELSAFFDKLRRNFMIDV